MEQTLLTVILAVALVMLFDNSPRFRRQYVITPIGSNYTIRQDWMFGNYCYYQRCPSFKFATSDEAQCFLMHNHNDIADFFS